MSIAPLVASDDADLTAWKAGDQSTFLSMACATVRNFCGWHIAPSITVTNQRCWLRERGLVMMGSTYVTAVSAVSIGGHTLTADSEYTWQATKGWLRVYPQSLSVPWPQPWNDPYASVTFTHGYNDAPQDVKAVIFEVVATAMELPASNAKRFSTMQYNFELNPDIGVSLSDNQKARLGSYKINTFGGLVRP